MLIAYQRVAMSATHNKKNKMGIFDTKSVGASSIGASVFSSGINALYNHYLYERQKRDEQDWWYEKQKYMEHHNSPAYQSNLRREAGLNPYEGVGSQPLSDVSSSLPNVPNQSLVNPDVVSNSLALMSEMDLQDAQAQQALANAGLLSEEEKLKAQERKNAKMQYFKILLDVSLGILDVKEARKRFKELSDAFDNGYTPTANEQRKADDEHVESEQRVAESKQNVTESQQRVDNMKETKNKLVEEARALKRANEIGDEFDKMMRWMESEALDATLTKLQNEAFKSKIDKYALEQFGIDMSTLNPVLAPPIYSLLINDLAGNISDEQWNELATNISNQAEYEINQHNKSINPDYMTSEQRKRYDLDIFKANVEAAKVDGQNLKYVWDAQRDEFYMDMEVLKYIQGVVNMFVPDVSIGTRTIKK